MRKTKNHENKIELRVCSNVEQLTCMDVDRSSNAFSTKIKVGFSGRKNSKNTVIRYWIPSSGINASVDFVNL